MVSNKGIVTVAIWSSDRLLRESLRGILGEESSFCTFDTPYHLETVEWWIRKITPNVLIYDVASACGDAFAFIARMGRCLPSMKVVMMAEHPTEEFIVHAVQQGAWACLPKTIGPRELVKAIRAVQDGEFWVTRGLFARILRSRRAEGTAVLANATSLTVRQQQIVTLIGSGMSNKVIASRLQITEATVKAHVNDIFRKLGLRRRVEIVMHLAHGHDLLAAQSTRSLN